MSSKKDHRGRPKDNDEAPVKFSLKIKDYAGTVVEYSFDREIHRSGTVSVEVLEDLHPEYTPKLNLKQTYVSGAPIVMVWKKKTKKAKPQMKVWITKNIDDVLTNEQAGIPKNSEILELAVGEGFIERYKSQYGI